jgi:hypothetical protein
VESELRCQLQDPADGTTVHRASAHQLHKRKGTNTTICAQVVSTCAAATLQAAHERTLICYRTDPTRPAACQAGRVDHLTTVVKLELRSGTMVEAEPLQNGKFIGVCVASNTFTCNTHPFIYPLTPWVLLKGCASWGVHLTRLHYHNWAKVNCIPLSAAAHVALLLQLSIQLPETPSIPRYVAKM